VCVCACVEFLHKHLVCDIHKQLFLCVTPHHTQEFDNSCVTPFTHSDFGILMCEGIIPRKFSNSSCRKQHETTHNPFLPCTLTGEPPFLTHVRQLTNYYPLCVTSASRTEIREFPCVRRITHRKSKIPV